MYPCPCCGFLTISDESHLTYEICPVCFWEDDPVQFKDHNFKGGANSMSLNEAKESFKNFGAVSKEFLDKVRKPLKEELP